MKTDRINWEKHFPYLRFIYICVVFLYLMFLTRSAIGQVMSPATSQRTGIASLQAEQQRIKVRKIYSSQIGVREKQPNSGTEVEKYLRYVNLPKGNPWCAAFVCWVLGSADIANPRTGWSPLLFPGDKVIWREWTMDSGQWTIGKPLKVNRQPARSDIFGLYFPEKGRIAHVGFVDEWKDRWVTTVEGNTNVLGSREGDGVYRKRRPVRSIYKVARYVQ